MRQEVYPAVGDDVTETGMRAPLGRMCGVTETGRRARHGCGRGAGDLGAVLSGREAVRLCPLSRWRVGCGGSRFGASFVACRGRVGARSDPVASAQLPQVLAKEGTSALFLLPAAWDVLEARGAREITEVTEELLLLTYAVLVLEAEVRAGHRSVEQQVE